MGWSLKTWPEGLRASLPLALPVAAVGMSFGLLAAPLLGAIPPIAMSAIVWSGTAQFAALSVLTSGGGTALAASTGLLANIRFLPMGFAIAPSMEAEPLRRFLTAAVLADASFVIAHRGGGRFDINALAWAAPVQYVAWLGGTIAGVGGCRCHRRSEPLGARRLVSGVLSHAAAAGTVPRARSRRARSINKAELAPDHRVGNGRRHHPCPYTNHSTRGPVLVAASAALIGLRAPRHPGAES